ncbi:MAG: helix-turn-helix transcriptional regulator [Treponema sp.]|nr:helix-turn-helix transcriptional regulator [Treponema sp.]
MDYGEIGQRIRKYRKLRNLSQEQLADKVHISLTHMSHIETGRTKLSLQVLVDLAVALETSTDSLLFDTVPLSRQELADAILHADERQLDFFGRMFSCMKACF